MASSARSFMEPNSLLGSRDPRAVCSVLSSLYVDHLISRGDVQAQKGRMINWKTPLKSEYRYLRLSVPLLRF